MAEPLSRFKYGAVFRRVHVRCRSLPNNRRAIEDRELKDSFDPAHKQL
jgi:hypothetical protein